MLLGVQVKRLREAKGLSQEQFAVESQVSPAVIRVLEEGGYISDSDRQKIDSALHRMKVRPSIEAGFQEKEKLTSLERAYLELKRRKNLEAEKDGVEFD